MRHVHPIRAISAAALAMTLGACDAPDDDGLVVFAASSLTDVFDELANEFELEHPDADVVVSYAGSSSLVAQLAEGAPADVLATADVATMEQAERNGSVVGAAHVFATNSLVIAVERGNPLGIDSLDDLVGGPLVVLASPEVPAGAYARALLDAAGIDVEVASLESNVRAVAAKVALGEADAGLVYRTDIGERLEAVEIDSGRLVRAEYPIAATSDDPLAAEFVAFVLGERGLAVLVDGGFGEP